MAERIPFPNVASLDALDDAARTLIVVGGGSLIDEAKYFVATSRPEIRLVALPSIWGSGAEASPIVVLERAGRKTAALDERYLPAARVDWPELATTVPENRAREACGDVWSHALEGFLSPLATPELRAELADLMREMLTVPLGHDLRWFDLSRRACRLQARSSVGLIHGIAHVLEPALTASFGRDWGHARLCSLYLAPVLRFDREASATAEERFEAHELPTAMILGVAERLFVRELYAQTLPVLGRDWEIVLRDPCSRTNCRLVRREHLAFFLETA